jgi:hypothetical protein
MTKAHSSKPDGKVIPFPALKLPHIGMASTCGQGNRISGSRTDIWFCPAYGADSRQLTLYVKVGLSDRAVMVETLAAQVAQAVGLPTPDPYIVTVKPTHVGQQGSKNLIAFATLDVSTRAMARPARSLDQLFSILEKLKLTDATCAFDEWVANDVRSSSDILICPESRLYLIDHEAAMAEQVEPDKAVTNWLAQQLMLGLTDTERALLLRRLRGRLAAFKRVMFDGAPLAVGYLQDGAAIYQELVAFLIARLEHLDRLLSQRVIPEQLYLSPEPDSLVVREKGQA